MCDALNEDQQAHITHGYIPIAMGIPQVLHDLTVAGHVLSCIAPDPARQSLQMLAAAKLDCYFLNRIYGPDTEADPYSAVIRRAMDKSGLSPANTTVITYNEAGIAAALETKAGRIIGFVDPRFGKGPRAAEKSQVFLERGADTIVRHYTDLDTIIIPTPAAPVSHVRSTVPPPPESKR
jgi:hypothetical protein